MVWNWQQLDWPDFQWSDARLRQAEEQFLVGGGIIVGTVRGLEPDAHERLIVESIGDEAMTTSEIEGDLLDRDSVQSSIRRQFGFTPAGPVAGHAERGIAEMMVDLYRSTDAPLTAEALFSWHRMLTSGRTDLRSIGGWRAHPEPMQVVSGRVYETTVHFEAPPSARMDDEMRAFVEWFERTAPTGAAPLPALTRAGIAHLYFVSIHPFEDGNGRIARAISEKALAQGLGGPTLTALAATILLRRRAYYEQLEAANKRNEVTTWLVWFAGVALEAQQRTQARIDFLLDTSRLLTRLADELNARQRKVLERVLREGPDGFDGGLSAGNYISITKTSPATARRDLGDLVHKGAFSRTGERRHARYHLTIPLRPVEPVTIDADGAVEPG
jgi:Fic family protein